MTDSVALLFLVTNNEVNPLNAVHYCDGYVTV